jgi:hypothetical protein
MRKHGPFPLSLAPDEFIANGVYETVSAPSPVRPETDDAAAKVEIVIRRVPPQQVKTLASKQQSKTP